MKSVLRPVLAAIQALLLLTLQLAEGTGVHRCPEHDGIGAAAPAADIAEHHGHQAQHDQKKHTGCHCLSTCSQVSHLYAASRAPSLARQVEISTGAEVSLATSLRSTVRLLPFAIGPPQIA